MAILYTSEIASVAVTVDAATTARYYCGFTFRNSSGGALVVPIYDGTDAGGVLIDAVALAAGASQSVVFGQSLPLSSGSIFVDWTTGIVGSIRVIV